MLAGSDRGRRGLEQGLEDRLTANAQSVVKGALDRLIDDAGHYADCCEWADAKRWLAASSKYGRWSTDRTPYLRGVAQALASSDPENRVVVLAKAAQMGGSEIALNEVLRRVDSGMASGILYYMENDNKAAAWTEERLKPALQTRTFRGRGVSFVDNRTYFPGGFLISNGIGSPAAVASTTASFVVGDEASRYPVSIGQEGDFLTLARQRTKTFGSSAKIFLVSTFRDSARGEGVFLDAFESGNQQEYECCCPHCSGFSVWSKDTLARDENDELCMVCPECGSFIHDGDEREQAVSNGRWEAKAERTKADVTSFRLSGFVAPADWRPWSEMLEEYDQAMSGKTSLQAYYNNVLGQPYNEPEARVPDRDTIRDIMTGADGKAPTYRSKVIPNNVACLTMAVDVQLKHIVWEIKGWAENLENYSIDRGRIDVDLSEPRLIALALKKVMEKEYRYQDGLRANSVWLGCIDESYETSAVEAVCGHFPQPVLIGDVCKVRYGALTPTRGAARLNAERLIMGTPGTRTARGKRLRAINFWRIGTDIAKRELYQSLARLSAPMKEDDTLPRNQSRPHAPIDYSDDYYAELTSEQVVSKVDKFSGRVVRAFYKPPRVANEALDLHVMNRVAAEILGVPVWDKLRFEKVRNTIPMIAKPKKKAPLSREAKRKRQQEAYEKRRAQRLQQDR